MTDALRLQLERVLRQPDPVDLPRRRAVLRYPGDPQRRQTVLIPLLVRWLQWRYLTQDGER